MRRVPRLPLIALLVAAAAFPVARTEPSAALQFVAPRRLATAVGASVAQLAVTPPTGATVVSVSFFVDGAAAGVRTAPPWTFSWAAGEGTLGHHLTALATFSDGTEARASVE